MLQAGRAVEEEHGGRRCRRGERWKRSVEADGADEESDRRETYRQMLQAGKTIEEEHRGR